MRPVAWKMKYTQDPEDPRYVKIIGEYDERVLIFAKMLGNPCFSDRGVACISGRPVWFREPIFEKTDPSNEEAGAMEVVQRGLQKPMLWPLSVIEHVVEQFDLFKVRTGLVDQHGDISVRLG